MQLLYHPTSTLSTPHRHALGYAHPPRLPMRSEDFRRLRTGHASCGRLSRVRVWALFTVPIVAVTACISITINAKSYALELMNWELKSGLGLGEHQVSGDTNRSEKSVGIAVLSYLFVLRVCHHEIVPGKPWSIFQLQHALRLRVMTHQVEHKVKVKMGKTRKAA